MFKIIYLNPDLTEDKVLHIMSKYSDFITDNPELALVEVAPVEQPFLFGDNERLVIDYDTFLLVIDEILSSLASRDQRRFELIINQVLNSKLN